jgi:nucleotide-binding universal stress UspA family protein
MASRESDGLDYLRSVAAAMGRELPVDVVVRFGDPVKEILQEAEDYSADLIVVSTSARSAIKRRLVGSVAEAVLRRADVPVLLHRAVG